MANEINIYEPRYLAEAVRTAPPICTFLRDRFFSKVKTFPTKNVDIDIVKGNRKMAAFVHPMVGGEIVQNEGYETKSYAPPLINPATVTTADMFLQRLPGEDIHIVRFDSGTVLSTPALPAEKSGDLPPWKAGA